jgi:hypothetical protein
MHPVLIPQVIRTCKSLHKNFETPINFIILKLILSYDRKTKAKFRIS